MPCQRLAAQAMDSTGMPPLELLALEAGRASRQHPIRAVAPALLCDPDNPLVDSASVAACAALPAARAAAIVAAFARGLEVPLDSATIAREPSDYPVCPPDLERTTGTRVLLARITPPVVGVREGVWEGRLTVELRCRSADAGRGDGIRTGGKAYLYQWIGGQWKMYQHSWWHSGR